MDVKGRGEGELGAVDVGGDCVDCFGCAAGGVGGLVGGRHSNGVVLVLNWTWEIKWGWGGEEAKWGGKGL